MNGTRETFVKNLPWTKRCRGVSDGIDWLCDEDEDDDDDDDVDDVVEVVVVVVGAMTSAGDQAAREDGNKPKNCSNQGNELKV